jgi:hypothetical protein
MSVFTIAIDRRFADELAMGVLAQYGGDPLVLADVLILLPTRRSVRALREAFLRAADGKPTILPRMAPLGATRCWHSWSRPSPTASYPLPSLPPRPCRWRASSADCSTSSPSKASPSTGWKAWSRATSPATGSVP